MEIKVLYEDQYLIALDKPSGLIVHSDGRAEEPTLTDWIEEKYPEVGGVGEDEIVQGKTLHRPGIVHRLDRDTSGVLVVARTQEAFEYLKDQFKNRKVQKIYRAFVRGKFKELEGVINKPIGRSSSDFRKWSAEPGAKGELRESVTVYKVLKQNDHFAYLELKPKTGRTHQLRVHLKAISHPILQDKLYGFKKVTALEDNLGFERLALHALSISLELPNGSFVQLESKLPEQFVRAESLL